MGNLTRPAATAAFCAFAMFVTAPSARADLVMLDASRDNTLYEDDFGSLSNGAGSHFFTGLTAQNQIRRGLLGFDLSGVPSGSTITGVSLTLHMSRALGGGSPVGLHSVLADWGEGASDAPGEEGAGANSEPGDATWLHTSFDDEFWTTPGGDFDAAASASTLVGGTGFYTWASTGALVDDVQGWLDAPSSNFGWLLQGDEETAFSAKRFDTRENEIADFRPVLAVEFTPVPGPSAFGLIAVAGLAGAGRRRRR